MTKIPLIDYDTEDDVLDIFWQGGCHRLTQLIDGIFLIKDEQGNIVGFSIYDWKKLWKNRAR